MFDTLIDLLSIEAISEQIGKDTQTAQFRFIV